MKGCKRDAGQPPPPGVPVAEAHSAVLRCSSTWWSPAARGTAAQVITVLSLLDATCFHSQLGTCVLDCGS